MSLLTLRQKPHTRRQWCWRPLVHIAALVREYGVRARISHVFDRERVRLSIHMELEFEPVRGWRHIEEAIERKERALGLRFSLVDLVRPFERLLAPGAVRRRLELIVQALLRSLTRPRTGPGQEKQRGDREYRSAHGMSLHVAHFDETNDVVDCPGS